MRPSLLFIHRSFVPICLQFTPCLHHSFLSITRSFLSIIYLTPIFIHRTFVPVSHSFISSLHSFGFFFPPLVHPSAPFILLSPPLIHFDLSLINLFPSITCPFLAINFIIPVSSSFLSICLQFILINHSFFHASVTLAPFYPSLGHSSLSYIHFEHSFIHLSPSLVHSYPSLIYFFRSFFSVPVSPLLASIYHSW